LALFSELTADGWRLAAGSSLRSIARFLTLTSLRCSNIVIPKEGTMANNAETTEGLSGIFDFTFTKFVTPVIIKILYILVLVFGGLLWIILLITSIFNGFAAFLGVLVFGTLGFLMTVLLYRVMFELVMVIFAIKENTDRLP
jgi:hypothetical protein